MRGILLCLVLIAAASPLTAQWRIGLEWMTTAYRGSSHDTSSSHVTSNARPGGGSAFALRISKQGHKIGMALRLAAATPGFAISGHEINLTDRTTGRLFEAATFVTTRVGGIGPSGAVRVELGPALHLWDFDGEYRARAGALGALAYEWPVASRFGGAIRLEGGVSKSWFDADEVPPEFERRLTWRYGVSLGLNYRL